MHGLKRTLLLAALSLSASGAAFAQLAAGQSKFLGGIYSEAQRVNFTQYFNQVTPENAGKWGSVEATRDVMNDAELRAAYNLAKSNGIPFRFHVLVWGSQQPDWIRSLPPAEQLQEIEEWFDWVAENYPEPEYLEVVNEPINQPPSVDQAGRGNYIGALGGAGTTGWDWIIKAFEMARQRFPASKTKLVLNEYSVINSDSRTTQYLQIINLLKERGLIDVIAEQGHAFTTRGANAQMKANLDRLAATGLPLMITEMDIDGGTDAANNDALQLADYQRIFPLFWEHPSVIGITLWGYRPGMWRTDQAAYLINRAGAERPALTWLRQYLTPAAPVIVAGQSFSVVQGWQSGRVIGTVRATDGDANTTFSNWTITGGTGASVFAINASTGQLTLSNPGALNAAATPSYTLNVRVSDGTNTSETGTVTVAVLPEGSTPTRLVALSARCRAGTGDETLIMGFVVNGTKQVLVQGIGPGIASSVPTALTDPHLKVYRLTGGQWASEAENNDWVNSPEILQARTRLGASAVAQGSKDAALLQDLNGGVYSAHVTTTGAAGVALVEAYDADASGSTRLMALATRTVAGAGDNTLIAGLVLEGSGPKTVLIRGLGPTLASRDGVSGVLSDPQLKLYRMAGGTATLVGENDNWGGSAEMKSVFTTIGAGPIESDSSKDAALLVTLDPGVYTVHVSGAAGTTGVALVEIFDVP